MKDEAGRNKEGSEVVKMKVLQLHKLKIKILLPVILLLSAQFTALGQTPKILETGNKNEKAQIHPEVIKNLEKIIAYVQKGKAKDSGGKWIQIGHLRTAVIKYPDYVKKFQAKEIEDGIIKIISENMNNKNWPKLYFAHSLEILGIVGTNKSVNFLKNLNKKHKSLELHVVVPLYQLGEKEFAVSTIKKYLKSKHSFTREVAILRLAATGDAAAEKLIEQMLSDPNKSVREEAKSALNRLKKKKKEDK